MLASLVEGLAGLDGLWWLLLLLVPFLFFQRRLHREIQAVFLILVRRGEIALAMFSILFFPGILLHEVSHYLMAHLLGVRTGRFSLLPRPLENGRLQLGFVETGSADVLRDALIGVAPLLAGGLFVAYAGLVRLSLNTVWGELAGGNPDAWLNGLAFLQSRPDFWLWFYLTFAVSSTMLPSSSDRRAWLPLTLAVVLLIGLGLLAGAGPWMLANLAPHLNRVLRALAVILGISLAVHLVLLPPFWLLRGLLSRVTGLSVEG